MILIKLRHKMLNFRTLTNRRKQHNVWSLFYASQCHFQTFHSYLMPIGLSKLFKIFSKRAWATSSRSKRSRLYKMIFSTRSLGKMAFLKIQILHKTQLSYSLWVSWTNRTSSWCLINQASFNSSISQTLITPKQTWWQLLQKFVTNKGKYKKHKFKPPTSKTQTSSALKIS